MFLAFQCDYLNQDDDLFFNMSGIVCELLAKKKYTFEFSSPESHYENESRLEVNN